MDMYIEGSRAYKTIVTYEAPARDTMKNTKTFSFTITSKINREFATETYSVIICMLAATILELKCYFSLPFGYFFMSIAHYTRGLR